MRQLIGVGAAVLLASVASAAEPDQPDQPDEAAGAGEVAEPAKAPGAEAKTEPAAKAAEPEKAEPPAAAEAAKPGKRAKPKIAVLDVRSAGTLDPKTFEGLSGLIASEIAVRAPAVQVIGSGDIRAMVGFEREKQLMGCAESTCLAEIGGALGVDWMLATEGARLGGTWILTMVLIDVPKSRPVKRLSQRTDQENKLVDVAVEAAAQMVAELPRQAAAAAAPPAAVEARPAAGGRSKLLTFGLVGGGGVAVVVGSIMLGMGYETSRTFYKGVREHEPTGVSFNDAKTANQLAIGGYVVGAVGLAAAVWGGLRLILPESPGQPQVGLAPSPGGAQATLQVRLP